MSKSIVIYVFHEYNERVDFFIKNCIFKDDKTDFLIVCNNFHEVFEVPEYVEVIRRENIGFDFAGWSHGIFHKENFKKYENYIFANSSIVGPYLPKNFEGNWTDIYIQGLKDNVKLFGSTINCEYYRRNDIPKEYHPFLFSHVQSYIFSMKQNTLEYLIQCGIFSNDTSMSFEETIEKKEIGMSRKIIENNWNIGCLMSIYKDVDFRFIYKKPQDYPIRFIGDVMFSHYINVFFLPEEIVFLKGNRCSKYPYPKLVKK
jgi:hypothetical protein